MKKELEVFEEYSKAKIHVDSLRETFKKVPNWKTPSHDGIHGYWFKNSLPSRRDRLLKSIDA